MIITLNEFKTYLNYEDTTNDTLLISLINAAQNTIEKYINYTLEKSVKTAILQGNGTNTIDFAKSFVPVTDFNLFKERATPLTEWTTVSTSNYAVYKKDSLNVLYYSAILQENSEYYFEYESGYEIAAVPESIKLVCKELSSALFQIQRENLYRVKQRGENTMGVTTTIVYDELLNKNITSRLDPYRLA